MSSFYSLAWRWHFYAGLFVAPFMILLALTGIIYLFKPQLDPLLYAHLMQVEPAGQTLDADAQLARVREAYPGANLQQYLPPIAADRSAQFLVAQNGRTLGVFVDPYRGTLLGTQDARYNLQAVARALHGELMIGPLGDRLIELAAGWGIVLLATGLYLWWPRGRGWKAVLWLRPGSRGRALWRQLHGVVGFWGALGLLFMLLSGMTWTGFWGQQFADVWNRFPAAMWNEVPQSQRLARALNSAERQTVPWAVEPTPLPRSGGHAGHAAGHAHAQPASEPRIGLQQVVDAAHARGVAPGYSITPPADAEGVYTVSLFADDPRDDATLHLDQYSGAVLAEVRWADYGPVARTVETGVKLHEGKLFGWPNQLAMLLVCLMILFSALSGLVIWWQRRPRGQLGVPPLPADLPRWKTGVAVMLALAVAFPLVGLSLLAVALLDRLLLAPWRRRGPGAPTLGNP
ncbi:PepSY-associated TM helix domain-containing protein [Stutzerimonas azotifigens]|uniref:PepSY-associated TM helix domain-containing protein n=1 Tax=Stutzerimonas azotifigens TaxID=291995 RepID=UPI000421E31A|nr:PepSY domain-containing protein [Stutzerimonas azotifigens]